MRCRLFITLITLEALVLLVLVASVHFAADRIAPFLRCNRQLVHVLDLTDLSIWTGARYTRHLSQADVFSAFQDGMGALERFPEGALATPLLPAEQLPSYIARREEPHDPAF